MSGVPPPTAHFQRAFGQRRGQRNPARYIGPMVQAIGIDIGGTGIKGAVVDTESGELVTPRAKRPPPEGGEPDAIVRTVTELLAEFGPEVDSQAPVGVCFPAVVRNGRTMSAANVSKQWIGLAAEQLFERSLARDITFVNDADAAGYAETPFAAAEGGERLALFTAPRPG